MQEEKKPDFSKPVDIQAYFYNSFHACGCSELDEMIKEVKRVLSWATQNIMERVCFSKLYENSGCFYLIAGLLDSVGFLEHGTSIRGTWATEAGKSFLGALNKFTEEEICNSEGEAYDGCIYYKSL